MMKYLIIFFLVFLNHLILYSQNCTVQGSNFEITSSPNEFPKTLTTAGTDLNDSEYFIWHKVPDEKINEGYGLSSIDINNNGTYIVRVMNTPSDSSNNKCFAEKNILIGARKVFLPKDTTICFEDSITIKAIGADYDLIWSTEDSSINDQLSSKSLDSINLKLNTAGEHKIKLEAGTYGETIIIDGDFENFDETLNFDHTLTGLNFETTYNISGEEGKLINGTNQFRVDDTIKAWSRGVSFCQNNPDYLIKTHPTTNERYSRGNFIYFDTFDGYFSSSLLDSTLEEQESYAKSYFYWQQTLPIEKSTNYTFSMDVSEWNYSPSSTLMILINGQAMDLFIDNINKDKYYSPPSGQDGCKWKTVSFNWHSNLEESITITISDISTIHSGGEIAIDDISFKPYYPKQIDELIIIADQCKPTAINQAIDLCSDSDQELITNSYDLNSLNDGITLGESFIDNWYLSLSDAKNSLNAIANPSSTTLKDTVKIFARTINSEPDYSVAEITFSIIPQNDEKCLTTSMQNAKRTKPNFYPNPVISNTLNINTNKKYHIINSKGIEVYSGYDKKLDTVNWSPGIYIFKTDTAISKFVIK